MGFTIFGAWHPPGSRLAHAWDAQNDDRSLGTFPTDLFGDKRWDSSRGYAVSENGIVHALDGPILCLVLRVEDGLGDSCDGADQSIVDHARFDLELSFEGMVLDMPITSPGIVVSGPLILSPLCGASVGLCVGRTRRTRTRFPYIAASLISEACSLPVH